MKIEIWKDGRIEDDLIGLCYIKMSALMLNKGGEDWFPLVFNNKPAGEVQIRSQFQPTKKAKLELAAIDNEHQNLENQNQTAQVENDDLDTQLNQIKDLRANNQQEFQMFQEENFRKQIELKANHKRLKKELREIKGKYEVENKEDGAIKAVLKALRQRKIKLL